MLNFRAVKGFQNILLPTKHQEDCKPFKTVEELRLVQIDWKK